MRKQISTFLIFAAVLFLGACNSGNKSEEEKISNTDTVSNQISYQTDSILVNGDYFTYRKIGADSQTAIPLVLFIHTRGNLNSWDPLLLERLASERPVITFNNRGVASSTGETPQSFAQMAEDGYQFIKALGYEQVDILGFSIGGCVAQELLFSHPDIVRKAILGGTSPKGARSINKRDPVIAEMVTRPSLGLEEFQALFFNTSDKSRELGKQFWERRTSERLPKDLPVSTNASKAQAKARLDWGNSTLDASQYEKIHHPVLIANGKVDVQMPTHNSVDLYNLLPNAQLILYPDSGHGFLFQYPEDFGNDANRFLNSGSK